MTLNLELDPRTEAWIREEAARRGIESDAFALEVLKKSMPVSLQESKPLTVESFHKMLDELKKGSEHLPDIPTSSFTRESFYGDRG